MVGRVERSCWAAVLGGVEGGQGHVAPGSLATWSGAREGTLCGVELISPIAAWTAVRAVASATRREHACSATTQIST